MTGCATSWPCCPASGRPSSALRDHAEDSARLALAAGCSERHGGAHPPPVGAARPGRRRGTAPGRRGLLTMASVRPPVADLLARPAPARAVGITALPPLRQPQAWRDGRAHRAGRPSRPCRARQAGGLRRSAGAAPGAHRAAPAGHPGRAPGRPGGRLPGGAGGARPGADGAHQRLRERGQPAHPHQEPGHPAAPAGCWPSPVDEGPDPEAALRERLILYRIFRDAGRGLRGRLESGWEVFRREPGAALASARAGLAARTRARRSMPRLLARGARDGPAPRAARRRRRRSCRAW